MRILGVLLICLAACQAQTEEASVTSVLRQMERAEQAGDFNALLSLFTRDKRADMEKMRPYARPRPDSQYRASKVFAQGNEGVILAQAGGADSFIVMTLIKEDGQWRIKDQLYRNTAADPNFVYALVPPAPGAFARDGFRWDQVAPGVAPAPVAKRSWNLKAVFDEAYLYLRIESDSDLPAQGATIKPPPPSGWPVLKINITGGSEYTLLDALNVGDQAAFGPDGKATSHRAFAAYSMRLEKNGKEVFTAPVDVGLHPERLLEVSGRNLDFRIPLLALGIYDSRATKMTVGDAQWPKSVFVSIDVRRYPK